MPDAPVQWTEEGEARSARWHSESAGAAPKRIEVADDTTRAAVAFHLLAEGTALLYRGDYHNARQLLTAVEKRIRAKEVPTTASPLERFRAHRQNRAEAHRLLSRLLVPVQGGESIPLRRSPDAGEAIREAMGRIDGLTLLPLTELLGMIGAREWRRKGVAIPFLGGAVHPHYGVFSPVRGEYVQLVAQAPLPPVTRAFDVGTGTGVLALVLARRGVKSIVASDLDPRAVACARENVERLGAAAAIDVRQADLFPDGRADLIVFNPPWIPARPTSEMERAVYDPDSKVLTRFVKELPEHLAPAGEAWLILSDLAEQLGLREEGFVARLADQAGLTLERVAEVQPSHPKASDPDDPLFEARSEERTALLRLRRRS